jgi:hypothetical protein
VTILSKNDISFLENKLGTKNYRVHLLGDFYVPGSDWNCGLRSPNCHFYAKLIDLIHSATCFHGLNQHNYPDNDCNLLDLGFFFTSNFADVSIDHAEYSPVQPDRFHPPFIIDCTMSVQRCKQYYNISYKRFSSGDYAVL